MARYLSNINLSGNQLQNALLHPTGTEPTALGAGQVYFNTGNNSLFVYDGSAWINVSGDILEVIAGSGLTGGGASGSVTLNIGQGDGITVSSASIAVNAEASQFSFPSGVLTISTGAIGGDELSNTGVTAGTYGNASSTPVFTVDVNGRITSASNTAISTSFNIAGDTGSDTVNTGETLTFSGTANEIVTTVTNNTVTIALPDDVTIGNNLTVTGNLTVLGTTTTVNTEEINLADNIIVLNSNATGEPSENAGIEIERGDSANVSFIWDEGEDRWSFTNDGTNYFNVRVPSEQDQTLLFYGKAQSAITKGQAVMFAGVQGSHFLIAPALQATIEENHEYILGIAKQDFAVNEFGYVTEFGKIENLDTSNFSEGDIIWFDSASSTAGAITATAPTPPNAKIQLAAVLRSHQTQGVLFVRPSIYYGIEEIENVNITNVSDGNLLAYNNTSGNWENTDDIQINTVSSGIFQTPNNLTETYTMQESHNGILIGPVTIQGNLIVPSNTNLRVL